VERLRAASPPVTGSFELSYDSSRIEGMTSREQLIVKTRAINNNGNVGL